MPVKYCESCGTSMSEDARFCPKCGKEVGVNSCSACGTKIPEGGRFCPKCGKETGSAPPESPKQQKRFQRHRWSKADTIPTILLAIVILVAVVYFDIFNLGLLNRQAAQPQTITAAANSALWAKANTALAGFLTEGFKRIGDAAVTPSTQQDLAQLTQHANDFSQAVKALDIQPQPEQAIMHRALLPVYQSMTAPMIGIRDALLANDPYAADLEWHKLALMLNEVGGVTEMLTINPSSTPGTSPPPTPSPTQKLPVVTPTPTPTVSPKPLPSVTPTPTPTVTAVPPPIQLNLSKPLNSDDFSNASSGWVSGSSDSGEFSYENGEYNLLVKKANWYIIGWNRSMGSQTDFGVEVEARVLSSGTEAEYGIIFRRVNPDGDSNFYLFDIKNGAYRLEKYVQGAWSTIQNWTSSSNIGIGQNTNRLKIVCKGTQFDLYANDQRLTSIIDSSITSGYIGLEAAQLNTHVHFDNFKLYAVSESK